MKTREHPQSQVNFRQWPDDEWERMWLEAKARHAQSKKTPSYSKTMTDIKSLIGLTAEYHYADYMKVPRPDPVSSVGNGRADFRDEKWGRVDVKGHDIRNEHSWLWSGTLPRTDTYVSIAVDVPAQWSVWRGIFRPADVEAHGVRQGTSIRVHIDQMHEDGTLVWSIDDPNSNQMTLNGVEPEREYLCHGYKREPHFVFASGFHRNLSKPQGIQTECKECKSHQERDRRLRGHSRS